MSQPPRSSGAGLPPDWDASPPDDLDVRHCYRHPGRETGVSCSNCGRPICYECMVQAPVGIRCPECVREQRGDGSRAKVVTRGQIRRRWGSGGGVMGGVAPITRILIGINLAAFVLELLLGAVGLMSGGSNDAIVAMGALVPVYIAQESEYWRLVTAMFLHGSIIHIAFNMYALYLGGSALELIAGRWKYLIIYLFSGVAGNVAVYVLASPVSTTIGASTAVFGVFGALFLYSVHYRDTAAGRALRNMGSLIVINLVITFLFPGISWQGHIGGLLGGMAALEALSWFGRRDLSAPIRGRDVALLACLVAFLVVIVVWRTGALVS